MFFWCFRTPWHRNLKKKKIRTKTKLSLWGSKSNIRKLCKEIIFFEDKDWNYEWQSCKYCFTKYMFALWIFYSLSVRCAIICHFYRTSFAAISIRARNGIHPVPRFDVNIPCIRDKLGIRDKLNALKTFRNWNENRNFLSGYRGLFRRLFACNVCTYVNHFPFRLRCIIR